MKNLTVHYSIELLDKLEQDVINGDVNCAQVFIGSPQRWSFTPIKHEGILKLIKEGQLRLLVHLPYTMNLASLESGFETSRHFYGVKHSLYKFMDYANEVGIKDFILHAGSSKLENHNKMQEHNAVKALLSRLDRIIGSWEEKNEVKAPVFHIEGTAGGGTSIGDHLILASFIPNATAGRFGYCLDLAHAYAYGEDFLSDAKSVDVVMSNVSIVHLNVPDEKVVIGKHLDRHSSLWSERKLNFDLPGWYNLIKKSEIPFVIECDTDKAWANRQFFLR